MAFVGAILQACEKIESGLVSVSQGTLACADFAIEVKTVM